MRQLRTFADWTLRPRLISIAGVAQVTAHGGGVERIEVRPDPSRMVARSVTLEQLGRAAANVQALSGLGFVDSGEGRLDIYSDSRLALWSVETQLADAVIAFRAGAPVRISDVATIVRGVEPPVGAAVYDGHPAVYVQVTKLPWADTVRTSDEVEKVLLALASELPAGGRIEPPVFRQASFVETSVRTVARSMTIGAVLVIFVLVAFLRQGRLAFISLTAIPLSLLAAVTTMTALGVSINGMTLGGLAIAVGEVVDDAIVDVENIWRRLRENAKLSAPRPPLDVIHDASREVRSSVVYATIIVVLVLIPVLLLGGIAGSIFSPLAQAYMLAIGGSLLVALTVTPALCAVLLPRLALAEARHTRLSEWMLGRYRRVLHWAVNHHRVVFTSAGLGAIAAIAVLPLLGGRFLPEFHEGGLIAHVYAAPGTSLADTIRLGTAVDKPARESAAAHVSARAGRAELDEDAAPANRIEMDFVLSPNSDAEPDAQVFEVAKAIGKVPGLAFVVEGFLGERIHELLSGVTAPVVVKVSGPELGTLRTVAAEIAGAMGQVPGLGAVRLEPQIDIPNIQVHPRAGDLARYGVTAAEVADAVVSYRQGKAVSQVLERDGRVVDVVLAGPPMLLRREALGDIPIETASGASVPLSTLASIDVVWMPSAVTRDGGERRIVVTADAPGAGLSSAVSALERQLRVMKLPQGYRVEVTGEGVARAQAASRLLLVGMLVLVGIFALLSSAFRSSADAGIVMLNFPLGLIGGIVGAVLTPEGLSVAGLVGFVTLFGIISRNGIMLVAHKRQLDVEAPNEDPIARIRRAAEERLLPIVMTAATAGLGLLPLALSFESAGTELEAPMALIVCGGLITSTALNMLVLPTVYVWLARRRERKSSPSPVGALG